MAKESIEAYIESLAARGLEIPVEDGRIFFYYNYDYIFPVISIGNLILY